MNRRVFFLLGTSCLLTAGTVDCPAGEEDVPMTDLRNRPELSLPLLDRKLIVAHYMTAWLGWHEAEPFGRQFNPVPEGDASTLVGTKSVCPMYGMVQVPPVVGLEEAVLRDLKAATRMGLDGFQFFYPIHMHDGFLRNYSLIVRTFIEQAEQAYPDFRITLCLCAPGSPASEPEMRTQWAEHIRWILDGTADSPIWLRMPDGRLIVYTWVPEGLVDALRAPGGPHMHHEEGIAATALAYEKLAQEIGERIAYVFHMRGVRANWYANTVFNYFPAAWFWADGNLSEDMTRLSTLARKRNRLFSPSVYPGFFGHEYKGEKATGNSSGNVREDPVETLWRPYMKTSQTQLYRDLLEGAVAVDATLISYITWNDYTEDTQLIPEVNHNFVLGVLLNYYKNIWLGKGEKNDRELAIVSYKKHRLDRLLPTDVRIRVSNAGDYGTLADESMTEIVTILDRPADLLVNGVKRGAVGAGLVSTQIPFEAGLVFVQVQRDGRDVFRLAPSEWSSDTPRRNDPVSVMLSTEFDRYFMDIFGSSAKPYRLTEYVP